MKLARCITKTVMALMLLLASYTAHAWSIEEVAEDVCGVVDGVSCSFEEHSGTYTFGAYDPANGGMGKIRSNAAYCLVRDGDGERADALVGSDWYEFGVKSRFHLTHAGQNGSNIYTAAGQRLLDLVIFGYTLPAAEIQNLAAEFPKEKERGSRYRCAKKVKFGKANICTQFVPYSRTGYYMSLETDSYDWTLDIDEILDTYLGISYPGFQMELGQHVPFLYAGTTNLAGTLLDLNDGILPPAAGNFNSWEWGVLPIEDEESDPSTSLIDVTVPAFTVGIASVRISIGVDLQGHYSLRESGDPDSPGSFTAAPGDPDSSIMDNVASPLGGATSTHIAASSGIEIGAQVCVDFGWFGTKCGDFVIFDDEIVGTQNPINSISYAPNGTPLHLQWAEENVSTDASAINSEISSCLSAPTIENEPEEPASPQQWQEFFEDVQTAFGQHYFICQKNNPPPPAVSFEEPSFKLCDSLGNVYEPTDGLYQEQ